ncbi:MAG: hypothetical protein QXF12_06380 [Candidatus Aenigmatarchaeota archaeon]
MKKIRYGYLYREYSEEEIDEILNSISQKISRMNNEYNREYYEELLNFYNYLVELKRSKSLENYLKEKIEEEKEIIETDPLMKEMEQMMKNELRKIEENDENIEMDNIDVDDYDLDD